MPLPGGRFGHASAWSLCTCGARFAGRSSTVVGTGTAESAKRCFHRTCCSLVSKAHESPDLSKRNASGTGRGFFGLGADELGPSEVGERFGDFASETGERIEAAPKGVAPPSISRDSSGSDLLSVPLLTDMDCGGGGSRRGSPGGCRTVSVRGSGGGS
jgi:hypothetical protein